MQKIRIDFDNPGLPQHISAVENDSQSRFFQATLYENGKAYTAPEGAAYSIMYHGFGPQNQGWYDTINDGAGKRAACAVSGNVVTCEIARQALQVPGHVSIVLCVTTGKGYMIKSWPIECDCKNDRYDSTAEIESFFYVTSVSNASWMQVIQAVEELKNIIDPTLSLSGKAADAAKVGEAVGELKEDLDEVHYVIKSNELFDKSKVENGGLYLSNSGEWYESASWWSTGLMPVGKYETIYVDAKHIEANGFQWTGIREDGKTYAGQGGVVKSEDGKSASFTVAGGLIAFFRIGFGIGTPQKGVSIRNTKTIKYTIDMSVVDGLNESIDGLNESIDGLNESIDGINERLENSHTKGIDDIAWENGYYINTSGVKDSNATFRISEKIYVNKGDEIHYSLTGYNNIVCVISAYDKVGNHIMDKSIMYDSSVGSGIKFVYSGTYIVESDVAYLIFCDWIDAEDSLTISYKSDKLEDISNRLSYVESAISNSGIVNQWKGMRISAFGTSITDTGNSTNAVDPNGDPTGKYLPYLVDMGKFAKLNPTPLSSSSFSEDNSSNFGIAGGSINGHILYYIRYYLDQSKPGVDGKHGNKAELITIEGSVNDYASSVPLGQVGDTVPFTNSLLTDSTENGTFAGACYCAFTEALQYAPNAVVVYLTESTGKYYEPNGNNFHQGRLNSIGLKQIDYINMAKAVAEYVGIPVIDCGRDSMINAQNPQYLVDWIHHTYLGGKQYASCIWSKLKDIPCKVTSVD